MKHSKQDLDAIIDKATHDIRDEQIDASVIDMAAARVWARVSQGGVSWRDHRKAALILASAAPPGHSAR